MHYVDWSGGNGQPGHLLYDPFEEEALLYAHGSHHVCPELRKALQGVFLIAEQKKRIEESTKVSSDTALSPDFALRTLNKSGASSWLHKILVLWHWN